MRPRPAEKRLAQAYSDVTSTASKMAASLHPTSRKRSTSGLFHFPWSAGELVGKAEQFHDFGLNWRAGIVQRQFATDGLVQAKPAEDFQVGRQTVGGNIQSAHHDGELFFQHPRQP